MRHDPRQDGPDYQAPLQEIRRQVNVLLALVQSVSAPLEPWLRKPGTFGECYFGFHAAAGLAGMVVIPALLFPQGDMGPMLLLCASTVALMVLHRVKGLRLIHVPGDSVTF